MANPMRDLTNSDMRTLRRLSADGLCKSAAARAMGVTHSWIDKSAKRLGITNQINALFPSGQSRAFVLTDKAMEDLRNLAESGVRKADAANAIGVSVSTLDKAAERQGITDEVKGLFPHGFHCPVYAEDEVEPIMPPDTRVTRWLTRAWRVERAMS